ncbi:MAG: alpha/beta hydrolase-fold protein [Erysipelotrichaceae bacterium]|nr:alpha/beta hydrolase-fold protein [Erysipelotrichaceae bacterium]
MIVKFDLFSTQLERNIKIHMYLPDDYISSQETYPVLYMFDGHNLFFDEDATFGRSWRMLNPLYELERKIIVVGLECNHNGNERLSEYAPYPFYDPEFGITVEAKGKQTMDFIVDTLKPYIDLHFPTIPNRMNTWIAGSSCGGLMAIYALCMHSQYFSRAVALSPYVLPSYTSLLYAAGKSRLKMPSGLYVSWGALEGTTGHAFISETKVLTDLANILIKKGVHIQFDVRPYGEHCEASWEEITPQFLRYLIK